MAGYYIEEKGDDQILKRFSKNPPLKDLVLIGFTHGYYVLAFYHSSIHKWGLSFCSPLDRFDKDVGIQIARKRVSIALPPAAPLYKIVTTAVMQGYKGIPNAVSSAIRAWARAGFGA